MLNVTVVAGQRQSRQDGDGDSYQRRPGSRSAGMYGVVPKRSSEGCKNTGAPEKKFRKKSKKRTQKNWVPLAVIVFNCR